MQSNNKHAGAIMGYYNVFDLPNLMIPNISVSSSLLFLIQD